MIKIKLKVPSSKEECNVSDCSVCDLNVLTCGDCEKIWEIGMDRMESCTSGKETPRVTYEDIKKSVEELRKQKEKIKRLQKEFIEQEVKRNPMFTGYYIDTGKKLLSLYGLPIYPEARKVPSSKIPIPSERPLVFCVTAGSSFGKKPLTFHVNEKKDGEWRESDDEGTIYNFDSKGKKISLKEMIEKREEKSALNRKVVLRENFC